MAARLVVVGEVMALTGREAAAALVVAGPTAAEVAPEAQSVATGGAMAWIGKAAAAVVVWRAAAGQVAALAVWKAVRPEVAM